MFEICHSLVFPSSDKLALSSTLRVAVLHRYQDPEFPRMWLSASALVSAGASNRARKSFQRNRSRRCRELATIPASVLHTLLLLFILPFAPG